MTLATTELAFRAASVALLLVLAASLVSDFRNVLAARLGAAFALGSAAHAASYSVDVTSRIPLLHAPLIALSTGTIVVFWLFTRSLFDDEFRLRWWHGWVWAL
ncbi:transcriptional regulatory protein [Bradyrhizobium diazoefficiens]|uniref:Transcriptional regulatory protein n=2 Tax=Bradyrhizobium diazoefficiens TaxID=1355477 RepID=A0A0E3VU51_9BRAD|nr:transcriptional regulatory protein [Bradyrhizobium diazoefficiens]